jgi:hypothetical protein
MRKFLLEGKQLREPLEANGVTINIIPQKALFIKDRNSQP